MAKISFLRRRDAMNLALQAAGQGWKRHRGKPGISVEYWEKELPGGDLNIVRSTSMIRDFDIQFVGSDGAVTKLGGARGSVEDAKVKAVLEASRKGITIFRPGKVENPSAPRSLHPGRLAAMDRRMGFSSKAFPSRSAAEQRAILDACAAEYGYRSCRASLMALENATGGTRQLEGYLVRKHGKGRAGVGRGAEWEAIPVLLAHVPPSKIRITVRQAEILTAETVEK